jgi:CRP/FNR family transcriptional regulator, anaerobic regulatory protein
MNLRQMKLVDRSQPALLLQLAASPAPDKTEATGFMEAICGQGDCLHLRPQQRVPLAAAGKVLILREGMLAIDATPAKGKLQVLDFLVPGDVVSASTILPMPGISLRAITSTSLVSLDPPAVDQAGPVHDYWTFQMAQCLNQLVRVNIHRLMIGRLETEPRVASFLLGLALRNVRDGTREITVELPMSRIDIANYLVINCDTLSRTMMRFCDCGLIERESRHAIRVIDLDALREKSPLASLLSAVFEKEAYRQGSALDPAPKETLSRASVHANHGAIPPLVTAGPLPIPVRSTLMPHTPHVAGGS